MSRYFILFIAKVNGIVSLISLSVFSLLVYRNVRDFCVLNLCPATLLYSLIILSNFMKMQNDRTLKDELPGGKVPNMLQEFSGEITPERMKGWRKNKQTKKNTPL